MKIYLVVSKECSLQHDDKLYIAGKPFEVSGEVYNEIKEYVEVIGVQNVDIKKEELTMEILPDDYVIPVEEKPKKKSK